MAGHRSRARRRSSRARRHSKGKSVPEGVAAFANAENTEAAKAFIKWFFSDDENMKMLAEIDHKNTCLLVKPSIEGLELDFDQSKLMKEDLSLFGAERTTILDKWNTLMGDKGEE